MKTLFCFLSFLPILPSAYAKNHAQVSVFILNSSLTPGQSTRLGLRMEIDAGWHTYYENAGDSGLGTVLKIENGEREVDAIAAVGALEYPTPHRINIGTLTNFGYGGASPTDLTLLSTLTVPATLKSGQTLKVNFIASWLICQTVCIPEKAHLTLSIPLTAKPGAPNPYLKTVFADAEERLPQMTHFPTTGHLIRGDSPPSGARAEIRIQSSIPQIADAIPITRKAVLHSIKPAFARSLTQTSVTFSMDERFLKAQGNSPTLEWILLQDAEHSYRFKTHTWSSTPFSPPLEPLALAAEAPKNGHSALEILRMIVFAFMGGLILNLMPCVFPVLSLKALSVLRVEKNSRTEIRIEGLFYTLGILVSFWSLASAILALRSQGNDLGWGFQLQNSGFILFLMILFFMMALNLLGVFEFNFAGVTAPLQNRLSHSNSRHKQVQAFSTGILAVLVATPCTAPFMGVALGFALAQPPGIAFGVFTALALGLAFPFLVLSLVPEVGRLFPRPGAWMQTLKELLSLPLFATVIWLGWVFVLQAPQNGLWKTFALLGIFAGTAVSIGKSQKLALPKIKLAGILVATIIALFWVTRPSPKTEWKPYTESAAIESLKSGHRVFVDFTAAWCITCQVNEKSTLEKPETLKYFSDHQFDLYVADWTEADSEITRRLEKLGRSGVPVYWVRLPEQPGKDYIMPQVLTPEILKNELNEILKTPRF